MTPKKIKKPPFFKPGSLVYKNSGHKLIKDGKYYRCSKKSNQMCKYAEKIISAENFERRFSRLARKMQCYDLDSDYLVERLMRDNLCDIIFGTEKKAKESIDLAEYTISAMQTDVESKSKILKTDEKDFENAVHNMLKADYPIILFGYAISMIRAFAVEMPEAEIGRMLAHYSKHIYLNDDGEIIGIELERWAWYCFNVVIEENNPGYLKDRGGLKIMNGIDELHKVPLVEASLMFGTEDFPDAMGENFIVSIGMIKILKDAMSYAVGGDIKKSSQNLPELLNQVMKNPAVGIVMRTLSVANVKL